MFKNLTVGKKIILGFSSILFLLAVVGIIAYSALTGASEGFGHYREMARDTNLAGRLQANMLMVRMNVKDFIITGSDKDIKEYQSYWDKVEGFQAEAQKEIHNPERAAKIDAVEAQLGNYDNGFHEVIEFRKQRNKLVYDVLDVKGPLMENTLTDIMVSAHNDSDMNAAYYSGIAMKHLLLARIYMAKFLDTNDSKAVDRVHSEFDKMVGQLDILDRELQNPRRRTMLKEASGAQKIYLTTFDALVKIIFDRNAVITETLDRIGPEVASNIEDVKLSIKAVQDDLGPKLVASNDRSNTMIIIIGFIAMITGVILAFVITRGITSTLSRIIEGMNEGADQVASASGQVASSSQTLAEGTSEQAASIEETSSSLEEMDSMTKQNADNAGQADSLMKDANRVVAQANSSMGELTTSMEEITKASEETSKIIKTIDEIAFQTNLLALNAAVEAARAGEAGAGFAVVADEVRNLAMRAADAAKNTADLIEGTVKKVTSGSELVTMTNDAFKQVAESSGKVGELVGEIAAASGEQAQGIEQINKAVTEMDKTVQQNAASAEESASASEEMNAQAEQMKSMVDELVVMVGGSAKEGNQQVGSSVNTYSPPSRQAEAYRAKNKQMVLPGKKEVSPEQVIPMDDDFSDF